MARHTKRKKHRLVVDLTVNKPITDREAVRELGLITDRMDLEAASSRNNDVYAEKISVKSFDRVLSAAGVPRSTHRTTR